MKRSTLLLLLTMAPGLGGDSVAFSNHAPAAGALRVELGAQPVYEYGTERQINALDEKNHSNEKRLLPAGLANEVDVKRLKLIFLLMMSLAPYRTPVR